MTINQQVNKNVTKEEYFNNNGKGFNSPHVIKIPDLNIKVEVYSHNLRESKLAKIESEVRETAVNFKNKFGLEHGNSEQTFKIYVFDDRSDYTHLGGSERFNFGLGEEGGKTHYIGREGVISKMFVYQQGGVHNLQHEFAHGLTYLATDGKSLPTVLMEGIAEYFGHYSDHKFNSQGSSIDKTEAANLNLSTILNLGYSDDSEAHILAYKTGHALIMYLQEKHPNLIGDYLSALRAGDSYKSQGLLEKIKGYDATFKSWLASSNTEAAMEQVNALQVTKGEFIITKKEIVDGEIKDVSYYRADIQTMDGEKVGSFSTVEHTSNSDGIRTTNRATGDLLRITKGEFSFLKVVSTSDGKYKLTYSDQHGNEYKDSHEYKMQILTEILPKYGENLEKPYQIKKENLKKEHYDKLEELDQQKDIEYEKALVSYREERDSQLLNAHGKYNKGEISYQDFTKEYHSIHADYSSKSQELWNSLQDRYTKLKSALSDEYEKSKGTLLDEVIRDGLEKVKTAIGIDVKKILEELINIDPGLIRSTSHIDLQEGKIFSLQALSRGDIGALSLYDGDTKLGELLSEAGLFKQVEGSNKETFFFEDILHNLYTGYHGGAYMAVTKEGEQYKASLIDGRKVQGDEYFHESHLHENELLHPSVGHIKKDLDPLLLRGTKILSHQDSQHAQYSEEQKASGVIVEKGRLLDNKGTDRTDDDIHEAVAKQGDETLYTFKNMGFYISEKGNLYVHDHGANVRFQLPKSITHLKLVQKDGEYKLVPSDSYGAEYSNIPDEYRYIDPIFAHEYEKREYSHKHVNIGLINLSKYSPGTLFAMKHDPYDYHIPRNSAGEIIRIRGQTYATKVKLFDNNDEEIGMLSNNFHNFKGKIFFSVDYNYSYSDFLASVSPQVEVEYREDGSKKITFDQGNGDVGDTNRGYTDHQRIFTKAKQVESQKQQNLQEEDGNGVFETASGSQRQQQNLQEEVGDGVFETAQKVFGESKKTFSEGLQITKESTQGIIDGISSRLSDGAQAVTEVASEISSWLSNWWSSGTEEAESSLQTSKEEDQMQSDQSASPPPGLIRTKRVTLPEEQAQEKMVLKDTILKIEKSRDQGPEGKQKAEITIDYYDIKGLYDKAEGAEKHYVLEFWHKLHASNYKVGALPEDKYYFEKGNFVIHNNQEKKLLILPEDKISIKIMKDGDHYDLAISDKSGKVISSISKIDHLSYSLLSSKDGFSLETQDSAEFSGHHDEYNLYLENGLANMLDCPTYHDHTFI